MKVEELFTKINFSDPQIEEALLERIKFMVQEDIVDDAYYFVHGVEPLLNDKNSLLGQNDALAVLFRKMVTWCKFVLFVQLQSEDVVDLLRSFYADHFEMIPFDYDLNRKIRAKVLTLFHEDRDQFKNNLRTALDENNQLLTADFITVNEQKERPTVAHWLQDFRVYLGERPSTTLLVNEYLTSALNVRTLSAEERERVRQLVTLYERLKLSSLTFEGIEDKLIYTDEQGNTFVLSEGGIERLNFGRSPIRRDENGNIVVAAPVPVDEAPAIAAAQSAAVVDSIPLDSTVGAVPPAAATGFGRLRQIYQDYLAGQSRIEQMEQDIMEETQGNNRRVEEDVLQSVLAGEVDRAVAGLFIMAKSGLLSALLLGGKKFMNILEPYLVKNFSPEIVQEFHDVPHSPAFMNALLHALLRGKLQLSESDSAIVALQLGEISFATGSYQYYGMTYGDAKKGQFSWHDLTPAAGHLVVSPWQVMSIQKKFFELEPETRWRMIQSGVFVTEDRRGRPRALHEVGREILHHLTAEDVEACDAFASNDFRQNVGDEDVLRQIEAEADSIASGKVDGIIATQAQVLRDLVDLLRV